DSACVLTLPSRDVAAAQVLLRAGFMPLSTLAVTGGARPARRHGRLPAELRIRRAGPADLAAVLHLALAELRYSVEVSGVVERTDSETLKRVALRYRLSTADPVWLAERHGEAVGLLESAVSDVDREASRPPLLRPGRWSFVNCLSVLPGVRGTGVGSQLVAAANREFIERGSDRGYVYYSSFNPLSSVFWPRHGYRPLWTTWELRPSAALLRPWGRRSACSPPRA
ncbi:MAG: GNAT family N-acetyltransferase, partial [Sciscionella sp.]